MRTVSILPRLLLLAVLACSLAAPARAQMVEEKTRRLSVFAPASERATARRLADQGDAALLRFAEDLGLSLPATRFKIYLYGTEAEYVAAEEPRTHGAFRQNLAFTYKNDAEVHMVFQPRVGRGAAGAQGEAPGMLEALAMHELSHALQYKTVPSYDEQPAWLSEGIADLMSERALAGGDTGLVDKVPWFADFFLDVSEALEKGLFVPLDRLLVEGTQSEDASERHCRYGTAYALARMLDDPAPTNEARRARFRAYVREVNALPLGEDVASRVNARFREVFGTPLKGSEGAPSIAPLERELVAYVRKAEAFPWQTVYRDVRATPEGALIVETFPESSGLALSTQPPLGPRGKVKATLTIAGDSAAKQADVIFGYRGRNDYWKLAFGSAGWATLLRYDGKWQTIAQSAVAPELLTPDQPHRVEVIYDVARLGATVDGKAIFRTALKDRTFGGGQFGVGAYDGRATWQEISGTSY